MQKGEFAIRYFSNSTLYHINVHIGAESYFFEEGTGEHYESAAYGGLRIDAEGNSVLTGLYDEHQHLIK
ncbi:GDYXXLXY domain-containing protein [Pedobacter sp. MC2016-14]|uniref:GDYXXLXY domain-containing protein n=1 Tax=Pedobacter sp. MC2016-14 TaxID=2897327 RepID=UPI001E425F09|nr:GDYXXLXY domain-containing protein [Pedobacter sp. MC2016-14]MCD0488475.1 GDYXXLXY domain-containing protein [Pedobacter sp. MC2016-14]